MPTRLDPSRTGLIRRAFIAEMRRRFHDLSKAVVELVVTDDAFGLEERPAAPFSIAKALRQGAPATLAERGSTDGYRHAVGEGIPWQRDIPGAYDVRIPHIPGAYQTTLVAHGERKVWQFRTDADKVDAYKKWLKQKIDEKILSTDAKGRPWTGKYVESAYKKGNLRAFMDAVGKKDLRQKGPLFFEGTKGQFLRSAFGSPEQLQKVKLLSTRSFESLEGVTAQMASKMNRILADGISQGKHPRVLGRELAKHVDGIDKKRALVIARTEIIHAHAEGQLDSFEDLGVDEVGAYAEWSTAGDDKVCPLCEALEGAIFSVKEARGKLPRHPNCVTGDMRIECPDPLAVMKGAFTGRIIEVLTTKGRRLSVTENHILLTKRGWVRAKELRKGDDLFDAATFYRLVGVLDPDPNHTVPTIEENFHALVKLGGVGSVVHSRDVRYFHGDGRSMDEEIHIQGLDGVLGYDVEAQLAGQFRELPLVLRRRFLNEGLSLPSQRSLAIHLRGAARAADDIMRRSGVSLILLGRALFHHDAVGLQATTKRGGSVNEDSTYDGSAETISLVESEGGDALVIEFSDLLAGAHADEQVLPESTAPETDRILAIEQRHVEHLPVYDVNTASSVYFLNGVLSSNCRCAWIPVTEVKERSRRVSMLKQVRESLEEEGGKSKSSWAGKMLAKTIPVKRKEPPKKSQSPIERTGFGPGQKKRKGEEDE